MRDGRRRVQALAGLRSLAQGPSVRPAPQLTPLLGAAGDACDLCGHPLAPDHRHLLDLAERRIVCTCEGCWALRSGEPQLVPVGHRTLWLEGFALPDDVWASFGIPIGLAFFMHSSVTECVIAMYPSPAGATESELRFSDWRRLVELNPVLGDLEADAEALIVNRLSEVSQTAIVPIDRAYELVGLVKASWDGISGGAPVERAVAGYFAAVRAAGAAA